MKWCSCYILLLSCWLLGTEDRAAAQEVQRIPDDVRGALADNAEALRRVSIEWERLQTSPWDKQRLKSDLGIGEYAFFVKPYVGKVVLQDNKYYEYSRFPTTNADGKIVYNDSEGSCDLTYWYSGSGVAYTVQLGGNPVLSVERLGDVQSRGNPRLLCTDYFAAAGFWVAERARDIGRPPMSLVLKSLSEGAGVVTWKDVDTDNAGLHFLEVLADGVPYRYWLSPAKNEAIVRAEMADKEGRSIYKVENSDFKRLPDTNLWLPMTSRMHWHQWRKNPRYFESPIVTEEYKVTMVGNKLVGDEVFQLKYAEPGSLIWDARVADQYGVDRKQVRYRAPANPADLDRAIESAAKGLAFQPDSGGGTSFLIIVNVVAVVVIVLAVTIRRFVPLHKRAPSGHTPEDE